VPDCCLLSISVHIDRLLNYFCKTCEQTFVFIFVIMVHYIYIYSFTVIFDRRRATGGNAIIKPLLLYLFSFLLHQHHNIFFSHYNLFSP